MPTITIGANNYEVYDTLANAEIYFAARVGATVWDAALDADKNKALVSASRWLDRITWKGAKTSDVQPISHPRTGLTDRDGIVVSSTVIFADIISAFFEMASAILVDATAPDVSGGTNPKRIKKVKADTAEVEFFPHSMSGGRFPTVIGELLGPFLGSLSSVVGAAYGTDQSSSFTADVDYGLDKPYA